MRHALTIINDVRGHPDTRSWSTRLNARAISKIRFSKTQGITPIADNARYVK